jgi:hypothetical protein
MRAIAKLHGMRLLARQAVEKTSERSSDEMQ